MEKIIISGEIGWEIKPADVKNQLGKLSGQDIDIHIASPGGFVFDGIEIFNAIRDYKRTYPSAQIMITIKGLAASMASYLAMNPVADMVVAEDNAVFMIHNPHGGAIGDYRDMNKMSEILSGLTDLLAGAYSKKAGKSAKEIQKLMDTESWYFGSEIKDAGFVDEIIPSPEKQERPAALAQAKLQFKALSEKLATIKIDYQQAAAMLAPENNSPAPNAGNINQEVLNMNLKEFLEQNPAAKKEYDDVLSAQFEAGKKILQAAIDMAAPFLNSKIYPDAIKNMAVDVIKGTAQPESLKSTIAAFDAVKESRASEEAQNESTATAGATGQQTPQPSIDGIIRNDADIEANVKGRK